MNISISEKEISFGNRYREMLIDNQKLEETYKIGLKEISKLKEEIVSKNMELSEIRNKPKLNMGNQTS